MLPTTGKRLLSAVRRCRYNCLCLPALALVAGCAGLTPRPPQLADCQAAFAASDAGLRAAGAIDAQAHRIPGFPYLRVNRLLASFTNQLDSRAAFGAWVDRMRTLARTGRDIELGLLYHDPARARVQSQRLADCAARMRKADLASSALRAALRARAKVPDDYDDGARVAGLYPLALPFLKLGIRRAHNRAQAAFAHSPMPAQASLRSYAPVRAGAPDVATVGRWLAAARTASPLGIPQLTPAQLRAVARRFAPVWHIQTEGRFDRPGAPRRVAGKPTVDPGRVQVYVQPAYTRFDGAVLLQLAYVIWFSKRPAHGRIDPLAGHLDGLIWRITLDTDGQPLLYDSIHDCGCYQMFFPTDRLRRSGTEHLWQAGALVPATAPDRGPLALLVRSGSHYLRSISVAGPQGAAVRHYRLRDYAALRRLQPRLFNDAGLVPGSERGERWFLWPSGVHSAGAMRQWGHHATAFVGKRHFDDPFLIGRYFKRRR